MIHQKFFWFWIISEQKLCFKDKAKINCLKTATCKTYEKYFDFHLKISPFTKNIS